MYEIITEQWRVSLLVQLEPNILAQYVLDEMLNT